MDNRTKIVDCHVHLNGLDNISNLVSIAERIGTNRFNIVSEVSREEVNENPAAFVAKAKHPELFYVFAGLDHSELLSKGKVSSLSLKEQAERLAAIGVDGFKLLESKPTARKLLETPLDSDYFAGFFEVAEQAKLPILWHVADPEEFWDANAAPGTVSQHDWQYDSRFPTKEELYSEAENVLNRHKELKVVFAHFFFLSADLNRASRVLDKYPGVHFDLAPGIEFIYNLSNNLEEARSFFARYSDRIVFGTDIWGSLSPEQAEMRSGLVKRWLESEDEFAVPSGADALLGQPDQGVIKGLNLPADVLDKIYHANFERLAGNVPHKLDNEQAANECERIAEEVAILKSEHAADTVAAVAAAHIRNSGVHRTT